LLIYKEHKDTKIKTC